MRRDWVRGPLHIIWRPNNRGFFDHKDRGVVFWGDAANGRCLDVLTRWGMLTVRGSKFSADRRRKISSIGTAWEDNVDVTGGIDNGTESA